MGGSKATLYKHLYDDEYKPVLSFRYVNDKYISFYRTPKDGNFGSNLYRYAYNVLDKNNKIIAHFYYCIGKRIGDKFVYKGTADFELRVSQKGGDAARFDNETLLVEGIQEKDTASMKLKVSSEISKELLLAVSNFIIPSVGLCIESVENL